MLTKVCPIILLLLTLHSVQIPALGTDSEVWESLGAGTDDVVRSMAEFNDLLVLGGSFKSAGSISTAHIATWNGQNWGTLGIGLDDAVEDLQLFEGNLIGAGRFTTASGNVVNHIARWDGSSWKPLGSGTDDWIRALAVYEDELVAAGSFTTAGGSAASSIARWDGSSWRSLAGGLNGTVYSLEVYSGELVAGGWFTDASGVEVNRIARWDGVSWKPLGEGVNDWIYSLANFQGKLIAGGRFTEAGQSVANHIAAWNGVSWESLDDGMNGWVRTVLGGEQLVAGGFFTEASGTRANHVALWDAGSWHPVGEGTNSEIRTLAIYQQQLHIGGWFASAQGETVNHTAKWLGPLSASYKLYFAQFADGGSPGSNLFSKATLINLSAGQSANVLVEVNDDEGLPLTIDLNGEVVPGIKELMIPAGGVKSLATDGEGALQSGSMTVSASTQLSGVLLFGGAVGMAGVGSSKPIRKFVAPIEVSADVGTGVAMMGLGTEQTIELELRDSQAVPVARASIDLAAKGHIARFIDQFLWDKPPDFTEFLGTLVASGEANFGAMVLLTTPGEFATQPVAPLD